MPPRCYPVLAHLLPMSPAQAPIVGRGTRRGEILPPTNFLTATSPASLLSLDAGVTPAEGSVKPTAGFTFNSFLSP